tara:strand:- start:95 stop:889 length:795 start_codon:yes stop_codon:yes gene_type:complete
MLKKYQNWLLNPLSFFQLFFAYIKKKFIVYYEKRAIKFFKKKDIYKYFVSGEIVEIKPEFIDLKNIFQLITSRKPKCILEFGVGFSTICICLALRENEKNGFSGELYTVDAEKSWLKNTEDKLPQELKKYVTFNYSTCSVSEVNNQLVSIYDNLPNISPNFIYLDGPSPESVSGNIRGLGFTKKVTENKSDEVTKSKKKTWHRRIVASDILLYESSAPSDFFILFDRRYVNVNFLRNNLKHKYTLKKDLAFGIVTFEKKYQPYP